MGGAPLAAQVAVYTHPLNALVDDRHDQRRRRLRVNGLEYGDYRLVYTAAGYARANRSSPSTPQR